MAIGLVVFVVLFAVVVVVVDKYFNTSGTTTTAAVAKAVAKFVSWAVRQSLRVPKTKFLCGIQGD